jgi:hypothetical protein
MARPVKHARHEILADTGVTFVVNHRGISDSIVCNHEIVRQMLPKRGMQLYPPADGVSYEDCVRLGEGEIVVVLRLPGIEFPICPMILNELPIGFVRKYGTFAGLSRQLLGLNHPEHITMISSMQQGIFQTPNLVLDTIYFGQMLRLGEQEVNLADNSPIVINEMRNQTRILPCLEPITRLAVDVPKVKLPKTFQLLDEIYCPWKEHSPLLPTEDPQLMWYLFVLSVKQRLPSLTEDTLVEYSTYKRTCAFFVRPQYRRYYTTEVTLLDLYLDGVPDTEYGLRYFQANSEQHTMNAFVFWSHFLMFHRMNDAGTPDEDDILDHNRPISDIGLFEIGEKAVELCLMVPSLAVALDIGHTPLPGQDNVLGAEVLQVTDRDSFLPAGVLSNGTNFLVECNETLGNRNSSSWNVCARAITFRARPGHGIGAHLL